ncbi:MAG: hypothetical protein JRN67_12730 [Nitrososphaerota archaeon]|nr:hypothetical protein [Nitrososphaerota archaeon]
MQSKTVKSSVALRRAIPLIICLVLVLMVLKTPIASNAQSSLKFTTWIALPNSTFSSGYADCRQLVIGEGSTQCSAFVYSDSNYCGCSAPNMTGTIAFSAEGGGIQVNPATCYVGEISLGVMGCGNLTLTGKRVGVIYLTATYSGDSNYLPSTATTAIPVTKLTPALSLACTNILLTPFSGGGPGTGSGTGTCSVSGGSQDLGGNITFASTGFIVTPSICQGDACNVDVSTDFSGKQTVTATFSGSAQAYPETLSTQVIASTNPPLPWSNDAPTFVGCFNSVSPSVFFPNLFVDDVDECRMGMSSGNYLLNGSSLSVTQGYGSGSVSLNSSGSVTCPFSCLVDVKGTHTGTVTLDLSWSGGPESSPSSSTVMLGVFNWTPYYVDSCYSFTLSCSVYQAPDLYFGNPEQTLDIAWVSSPTGALNVSSCVLQPQSITLADYNVPGSVKYNLCGASFYGEKGLLTVNTTIESSSGYLYGSSSSLIEPNYPEVVTTTGNNSPSTTPGGAIPEFPFQLAATAALTIIVVFSYLLFTRRRNITSN